LRAIKAAFAELQTALSDDQKRIADTLLTQPLCLGPMGMM
jgi:hypothetical protein